VTDVTLYLSIMELFVSYLNGLLQQSEWFPVTPFAGCHRMSVNWDYLVGKKANVQHLFIFSYCLFGVQPNNPGSIGRHVVDAQLQLQLRPLPAPAG